jgi:dihydrofolate reductase
MKIALIAAKTLNNVIGKDNGIPWKLPSDMKRFKNLTMGKVILMGRNTFQSIGSTPLPNRTNIVVTKSLEFADQFTYGQPTLMAVTSLAAGLHLAMQVAHGKVELTGQDDLEEVMVIGGHSLYRDCLPMAHRLYLTTINAECKGDVKFPEINLSDWTVSWSEELVDEKSFLADAEDKTPLTYKFEILDRKPTESISENV